MNSYQNSKINKFQKILINREYEKATPMMNQMKKSGIPQALINYHTEPIISNLINAKNNPKEAKKLVKIIDPNNELGWKSWLTK